MKNYLKIILSLLLMISITVSSFGGFSVNAATEQLANNFYPSKSFIRIENNDSIRYLGSTGNAEIADEDFPHNLQTTSNCDAETNHKLCIAKTSALPSFVDNSTSRFFPAIGNQEQLGSCQYWAQVYYQFTYTMNKSMGVTTTPDNTFSPQWAYNIVASTDDRVGTYYDVYTMMKVQGNVFQSQVPYTQDTRSFSPTEEIWKTAIQYRLKDYQKFDSIGDKEHKITSPDDPDLSALKTSVSNGDVVAFSSYIYSWDVTKLKQNSSAPENAKYMDQEVLRQVDGSQGSHRLTIVGYNDNIWTDINNNNAVDKGEMGAFKIANSWGAGWGNSGFLWIAYDALNEVSYVNGVEPNTSRNAAVSEASRIDVLKHKEDSELYLKYTLNTSDRTQVRLTITIEKDGTPYKRQVYSNIYHGDKIAYDGSTNATDATMVALLSNVMEGIKSEDLSHYSMSVTFEDIAKDSNVLTVKDARIVDETAGKEYIANNTFPLTLDGEAQTVQYSQSTLNHAIVYYRGYDTPSIHYKTGDSDFTEAELKPNTERRGYVYKYVIDLKNSDSATMYFTDKNGNTDNNQGKFFTAKKGINYFVTENVAQQIIGVLTNDFSNVCDVDTGCNFDITASGGYAPYQYRYSFTNLSTNEKTTEEFKDNSNTTFYFRHEGKYKVSVEVKDFSDKVETIESIIEVKDIPFSFKEMYTQKPAYLVGDTVTLNAFTQNEKIHYTGVPNNKYDITVKDNDGNICHTSNIRCKTYDLAKRFCFVVDNFDVHKSGTYTATISSTDNNKEYATMSITFDVFDKTIGDTNSNGSITVVDATQLQLMLVGSISADDINKELSDCDQNAKINILDATHIQRYLAQKADCGHVGETVEYIPPIKPTEPTEKPTEKPTDPPVIPTDPPVAKNTVTFTNSFKWGGTISCYYWSDSNTAMTTWPGKAMTNAGVNEYGETMYTLDIPQGATYIIFTNGSVQTTDISYKGGEVRYYPISTTDSKGHNLVKTW